MHKIRVGFGYDVHQLKQGYKLMIGGVEIPSDKGALGHSDADVLIHAIMDAIFGAAGMRDIGFNFPDNDPQYKAIDSKLLLARCYQKIKEKGFLIGNIDATVCLQFPKIGKFIPEMQSVMAKILELDKEDVSVKATTTENLGFVGKGEGIASQAVVLLVKNGN